MRYAFKRDAIEPEIVEALRWAGYQVEYMKPPACWDLTVWRDGMPKWLFLEVKLPKENLTEAQEDFWARTPGMPREIVRSIEEALWAAKKWC